MKQPWREGIEEFYSLVGETLEFEQFEPREFVARRHGRRGLRAKRRQTDRP
jgi:hypothetical protein